IKTDKTRETGGIRGRGGGRGQRGGAEKRGKAYAVSHGVQRGFYSGTHDAKPHSSSSTISDIPHDALGEGLYQYIQALICRRRLLARIFKNSEPAVSSDVCCDLCNPKLFDHTRPSKPVRSTRQKGIRRGPVVDSVRDALFTWRRNIKQMHFPRSLFAPHALLNDSTCDLLASVGPIESEDMLKQLLESSWSYWDRFGRQLYVYLHNLEIPPLPPPPSRQKQTAAAASTAAIPQSQVPGGPTARKRAHPTHSTPNDAAATPPQRLRRDAAGTSAPSPASSTSTTHPGHPYSSSQRRPLYAIPPASSPYPYSHHPTPPPAPALAQHSLGIPSTPMRAMSTPTASPYPSTPSAASTLYATPWYINNAHYYPGYAYPPQFQPHSTFNNPPSTPTTLYNNPYAALASPAFTVPSPSPVTSLSPPVTTSPTPSHPSSAPSSSSFTPDPGPNNSTSS
ncbi:hypothetical protein R3P38DRAFT_2905663, partial [Favolaschia claudopus]